MYQARLKGQVEGRMRTWIRVAYSALWGSESRWVKESSTHPPFKNGTGVLIVLRDNGKRWFLIGPLTVFIRLQNPRTLMIAGPGSPATVIVYEIFVIGSHHLVRGSITDTWTR